MTPQHNPTDENSDVTDVAAERVRIFDTTLRDGEQAPGFSMDRRAKLRMAHALEALGVDIIEAGFPQASPDDFDAVAEIARALRGPTICGLARCQTGDIDSAGRALERAHHSRIHLFLSTSPLHREHKLGMSKAAGDRHRLSPRSNGPRRLATRWSSPPRTRCAPSPSSWSRCSAPPPPPAPPRSTRRTRWATPRRRKSPNCSPICANMCAARIR